jgi:long-chain fatty acid transport protein
LHYTGRCKRIERETIDEGMSIDTDISLSMENRIKTNLILPITVLLAGIVLVFSGSALAGPILGARSAAMGCAFTAVDSDPSAIAHNPAGIINAKDSQLYLGVSAVMFSTRYQNSEGQSQSTRFQVFYPPHLFLSQEIGRKDVVIGLGLYSPFGIGGRSWREGGLTRYISTENTIATYSLNPAIAWKMFPWLAVGLSPNCMIMQNDSERMIDQSSLAWSDARLSLEVDGVGYGYILGVLIMPVKNLSVGIFYRSKVRVDQEGTATLENIAPALQGLFGGSRFETRAKTSIDFPWIRGVGIAWRPSQKLLLTMDLEQYGWSSFDMQEIDFITEIPQAEFTDTSILLEWEDSWVLDLGIELDLNKKFTIRAGYSFIQNFVPEMTFSPANPNDDQHAFSIGLGYHPRDNLVIDVFYVIDYFLSRDIKNDILSGTYDNICHFSGMSLGYSF